MTIARIELTVAAGIALWVWPVYEAIHGGWLLGILSVAIESAGGALVWFALLVLTSPKRSDG